MLSPQVIPFALLLTPCLAANRGPAVPQSNIPPKVDPTKLENFTWVDPFSSPKLHQFDTACESSRTFSASEFQLHDLSEPEPEGLLPFKDKLAAAFGARNYPGGWEGMDAHGYERNLLKMEFKDVPTDVKEWIAAQTKDDGPGKGLFAVIDRPLKDGAGADAKESEEVHSLDEDKILLFAPGALYETLPLWLAQDSDCQGSFTDLSRYSTKFIDGGVIGWPTEYTYPARDKGEREMSFTLRAQVLSGQASTSEKIGQETVKNEGKDEL